MGYFTYEGRLNRAKYIGYSLATTLVALVIAVLLHSLPALGGIIYLLSAVVNSTFVVRRFHDIEKPGWWFWLLLIPFYNIYLVILLIFKKGTTGSNNFGVDPLPVAAPTVA